MTNAPSSTTATLTYRASIVSRIRSASNSHSLLAGATDTHVSRFDSSNAGLELGSGRAFGVLCCDEPSHGPQDIFYLFEQLVGIIRGSQQ